MSITLFPQIDKHAERRRVLAKVYRLLLRLAEEAESKTITPNIDVMVEKKISEPVLVKEDFLNK